MKRLCVLLLPAFLLLYSCKSTVTKVTSGVETVKSYCASFSIGDNKFLKANQPQEEKENFLPSSSLLFIKLGFGKVFN